MEDKHYYDNAVGLLTAKSEALIEQYPRLKRLQSEVDRRLSNASDKDSRQEILNIMYHASRNELHAGLNRLNRLLDSFSAPETELLS
ncbi:hypothetical protein [uncultured Desulfosarcina sp.]|uniref:hypothetical protein n=1 Tax=uncultured Desulfosarcina sp. TaxID=218289 RepID=UPI0029C8D3E5|nr:hypothetical protein [uncultured Desulfosarcina sp.]